MKKTCPATAGPNAKKSAHMMKTTTADIDDGSGGSGTGTSYTCSAAATSR